MDLDFLVVLVAEDNLNAIQNSVADIFFTAYVRKSVAKYLIVRFLGPTGTQRVWC